MFRKSSTIPPSETPCPAPLPAAADGELLPGLARKRNDARDIGRVGNLNDDGWAAVNPADEDRARLVVCGVARSDHQTLEGGAKLGNGEGGAVLCVS
jgi:hypothetical protein